MMFVMWVVMMIAMMTPTATPMILLFAAINRKRRERDAPYIPTAFFLGGYLAAWVGFSAAATLSRWGSAPGGAAFAHDHEHECPAGGRSADGGRGFPMAAPEAYLPTALPVTVEFPHYRMG